jgi:hypothetical protein
MSSRRSGGYHSGDDRRGAPQLSAFALQGEDGFTQPDPAPVTGFSEEQALEHIDALYRTA